MSKKNNKQKKRAHQNNKNEKKIVPVKSIVNPEVYNEQLEEIESMITGLEKQSELVEVSDLGAATDDNAGTTQEEPESEVLCDGETLESCSVIEETISENETEVDETEVDETEVDETEVDDIEVFEVETQSVEEEINQTMGIMTKDEKKARRRKFMKRFLISLLIIALILGGVYLGGAYYFTTHFFYNTTVNEQKVDFVDEGRVHELLTKDVEEYEISIKLNDETSEIIAGTSIELTYKQTDEIATAIEKQNIWKWPMTILDDKTIEFELSVELDFELLTSVVGGFEFMNLEEYDSPVNAYPKVVKNEVTIIEEEFGNEVSEDFIDILKERVETLADTFDMESEGGYALPEYTSESEAVINAKETMEQYLNNTITYSEGDVIDFDMIADWIKVNKSSLKITFNEDKITEFVAGLAKKYNTVGTSRTFNNPDGKQVSVTGGSYGWTVDQTAEVEKILENLKGDEAVKRTIEYSKKASSHGDADWGSTFAMIDLTNQKMWMVVDGEVVVSSDVVTGSVAAGNATPEGVYSVSYTTTNATLRGAIQADGTRAYETPVAYWMPFNGGIGFHDATWRSSFGGTIYKNSGSHGCINMPFEKAKALYGYLKAGMPVICHF